MKLLDVLGNVLVETNTITWDEKECGWRVNNEIIVDPSRSMYIATGSPQLTPLEFKMCFTVQERIAIKTAKANDPVLQDVYEILDDYRLRTVDLGLASNQMLIDYLVGLGCITSERAAQIKQGIQL